MSKPQAYILIQGDLRITGNLCIGSSENVPVPLHSFLSVQGDVVVEGNVIINGGDAVQDTPDTEIPGHPLTHIKCRGEFYGRSDVKRAVVSDELVSWDVSFPDYAPVPYTAPPVLKSPPWADVDWSGTDDANAQWNSLDGKVDRRSHAGLYQVVDGLPRNLVGRTGIVRRGLLGRWGPNHAADPIVTRWKRDEEGRISTDAQSGKPILQFVAIQRGDTKEWALPGGMVDPGEAVTVTLVREFCEEALNSTQAADQDRAAVEDNIRKTFKDGKEIYRGYVDDPRNTDNAWMETVAVNFHDDSGENIGRFNLHAGDDAVGVKWMAATSQLQLYASHIDFLKKTVEELNAFW